MDAKRELVNQLCEMFPNDKARISEILSCYTVRRESDRRSNLKQQLHSFLIAKKIDGLSPKTLKNYREMLNAFAAQVDKHVAQITTDDIRGYIGYLAEERKLKESSIQTHINTLRSFFGWLEVEEIIKKNPTRKIKSLKIDRMRARRPLTAEQLEQLRDGCQTYKEKAIVEFLVSTGCRLGEMVGIQLEQVDWQNRSVVVLGKGNKERTVYFSVRAKLMLQEYQARRKGGNTLFAISRAPYGPMTPRAVQRMLKKIGERTKGLRHIHPHILRHTFASNALNSGMDITVIQHLLGHTDPKTTLIYAELSTRMIQFEYEKIVA